MRRHRFALAALAAVFVATLTGCGETVVPDVAASDGASASVAPKLQRATTAAGTITAVCTDALEDSSIADSTELAEVRLERTEAGLAVEWETTGFYMGVTEYFVHAVNASNQNYFDTLYVRTADGRVQDSYWREYTNSTPAVTHYLDDSPSGSNKMLRAVFPAEVLDHLESGFRWNASVRHNQGGHDSCPDGGSDAELIFDDGR